jgi:hypothetical protein
MTAQQNTEIKTYRGLLECPLRRGYIEFEFAAGDTVSGLKASVRQVWGAPSSGGGQDLDRHGFLLTIEW